MGVVDERGPFVDKGACEVERCDSATSTVGAFEDEMGDVMVMEDLRCSEA